MPSLKCGPRGSAQADTPAWETVRQLRYGALVKLFRHRWGYVLPQDDAGRDDLWLLVTNVSLAAVEPQKKMRHAIAVWAPWIEPEEAAAYVELVWGLDIYERIPTAQELGRRLRLTNAERLLLKLWPFKPIDATDAELAEQRRARRNERRRAKRGRTRAEYEAASLTKQRPWQAEGISRGTWYRRRAKSSETSAGPTIVFTAVTTPVSSLADRLKKGIQQVPASKPNTPTNVRKTANASGLPGLGPHLSHRERSKR